MGDNLSLPSSDEEDHNVIANLWRDGEWTLENVPYLMKKHTLGFWKYVEQLEDELGEDKTVERLQWLADQEPIRRELQCGLAGYLFWKWRETTDSGQKNVDEKMVRYLILSAQYMKMAADNGLPEAQLGYAECCYSGLGVRQSFEDTFRYGQMACDSGLLMAQHSFIVCNYHWTGVGVDLKTVVDWGRSRVENGNSLMQLMYGMFVFKGEGCRQDYMTAVKWFKRAAMQGSTAAEWLCGLCHFFGKGCERDFEKAEDHFNRARRNGDPVGAYCYLAFKLTEGYREGEDIASIMEPYWEIAFDVQKRGCSDAANFIWLHALLEDPSMFTELVQSVIFYRMNLCLAYNYGAYLISGNSCDIDTIESAAQRFRKVAQQNQGCEKLSYSWFLTQGNGYDLEPRWRHLKEEASICPESAFLYGKYLYRKGQKDEALKYFKQAADFGNLGHSEAKFVYAAVQEHDFHQKVDDTLLKYYRMAADDGVLCAQYALGELLMNKESRKEKMMGVRYLQMAAKEVLDRRQCFWLSSPELPIEFCYNIIPDGMLCPVTESYIYQHLPENLAQYLNN